MDPLTITVHIIQAVAVIVLGIGMIFLALTVRRFRQSLDTMDEALKTVGRDARPVLDRARAVGENLNFIVMSVRREVDRVGNTIASANERLEEALEAAEARVQDLTVLIDVVQGEVEDTVLSATSALRGLRTGARLLRRSRKNNEEESELEDLEE